MDDQNQVLPLRGCSTIALLRTTSGSVILSAVPSPDRAPGGGGSWGGSEGLKTRSFPSGDAPRSLRSGRQPNRGRYHYYVILRSGATKNLTLPSICHPEGLFYRPIAPPEGEDLGWF